MVEFLMMSDFIEVFAIPLNNKLYIITRVLFIYRGQIFQELAAHVLDFFFEGSQLVFEFSLVEASGHLAVSLTQ